MCPIVEVLALSFSVLQRCLAFCHLCLSFNVQIEDLSQQAQMAAAEKFKAPDVSHVGGAAPATVPQAIPEESDEEVKALPTFPQN